MTGIPDPDGRIEPVRDLSMRRRALYVAMLVPLAAAGIFAGFTNGWGPAVGGIVALGALLALAIWIVSGRRTHAGDRGAGQGRTRDHGDRVAIGSRPARSPARPGDPAGRLAGFLERLDRLPTDGVRLLAVRPLDVAAHEAASEWARQAARDHGRATMVEDATVYIAEWIGRAFGTRSFDPELVALAWRHEPLRIADRDRLQATLSDAALAVAVEDIVDEPTYGELVGPCGRLTGDEPDQGAGDLAPR